MINYSNLRQEGFFVFIHTFVSTSGMLNRWIDEVVRLEPKFAKEHDYLWHVEIYHEFTTVYEHFPDPLPGLLYAISNMPLFDMYSGTICNTNYITLHWTRASGAEFCKPKMSCMLEKNWAIFFKTLTWSVFTLT